MVQYNWWIKNIPKKPIAFKNWLGNVDNISRKWFRDFIVSEGITSVLDVACGPCVDKEGFDRDKIEVKYKGIDISPYLIEENKALGYDCEIGNIENIQEGDSSWDVVYARHIVEHLEYYEEALDEMVRVAKRYVVVVHFLQMNQDKDEIIIKENSGDIFYENEYEYDKFIKYCEGLGEVTRVDVNDNIPQTITVIEKNQ